MSSPTLKAEQVFDEIARRPGLIVGAALILILVTGSIVASIHVRETRASAANELLFQARKSVEEEEKALTASATPAPDVKSSARSEYKKMDVAAKFPEGLKKLKSVMDQYPNTRAAFEARMSVGELYYNHGNPLEAMTWFQMAADHAPQISDRAAALQSVGYSLENQGKFSEAIDAYQKALDQGISDLRGDLMLAKARCYELLKNTDKARSTYDEVIAQLPNTEASQSALAAKASLPQK